ncbi:hypothetical protein [Tepidibacter thalassicus]|uniref:Uncharacterized protein n=1 Tax=Tepidibacter thalassicus DSM 15285 TaxID=1123350 RepID=A0A1M5PXK2_9FIRM|nr:hypothetical protein [Tepidibacter thalassicus]SHH06261.1 hypothetical protein SAMN02744040_00650 [Tepidibacter thalassicus DSM 15285]
MQITKVDIIDLAVKIEQNTNCTKKEAAQEILNVSDRELVKIIGR